MPGLNAKPEAIDIDPRQTAILVVDMQNAFASKGGMFDLAGLDISGAAAAVAACKSVVDAARAAKMKVIHLRMTYQEGLGDAGGPDSPNYHKELGMIMMRNRPELAGKLLIENTWDWQIVDALTPGDQDIVINKTRYSGFCNTVLDATLKQEGIRNLLLMGIATNICVESTARDAYFAEYWPILVEEGTNHSGPDFNRQATLWNMEHVFGWVTSSSQVIDYLSA